MFMKSNDPLFTTSTSLVDQKKRIAYAKLLNYLFKFGNTPIAKLAKEIHSSVPSVTALLSDLMQIDWVEEKGAAKTKSGRRPVFYDLKASKKIVLVIDINIYETQLAFINLHNEIINKISIDVYIEDDNYYTIISKKLEELFEEKSTPWAIGISAPGLIEIGTGKNYSHLMLNPKEQSMADTLSELFKIPVFTINDTRSALLGEHYYGLAKNKNNGLMINIDWGIGLGILLNGTIVEGADGFAGELGHIQVDPDGILCHCGKVGCLETMTSASTILRKVEEGIAANKPTSLKHIAGSISLNNVIDAAINGDEFSIDIIYEVGKVLGKGISAAVHLFNPEIIIIHGFLKNADDLIISTLKQSINKYCLTPFRRNLEIEISPLGDDSKIYGTKSFVFDKMMELYTQN